MTDMTITELVESRTFRSSSNFVVNVDVTNPGNTSRMTITSNAITHHSFAAREYSVKLYSDDTGLLAQDLLIFCTSILELCDTHITEYSRTQQFLRWFKTRKPARTYVMVYGGSLNIENNTFTEATFVGDHANACIYFSSAKEVSYVHHMLTHELNIKLPVQFQDHSVAAQS